MSNLQGQGGNAPIRVLFVEDDTSVAEMYRMKLELDGYDVAVAGDGVAGLEMARQLKPDLLFLDVRLPKLDGMGVLEGLRAEPGTKDIRVVILSNWNERELVERGAELGALDHLVKSQTTPARLSNGIAEWLSR